MPLINILKKENNDEIINFCKIMKNKINSENKQDILLALNLLDLAVDLDKMILWERIDSKDFLSCIINILNHNRDTDIQSICKYLIKKIADKFKNYPSLPNFPYLYKNLRKSNTKIPDSIKHSYINIAENKNKPMRQQGFCYNATVRKRQHEAQLLEAMRRTLLSHMAVPGRHNVPSRKLRVE